MRIKSSAAIAALLLAVLGTGATMAQGFKLPPLLIQSKAFEDGGIVPLKYANAGGSTMPDFTITNAPEGTVSYAVILHDIDVAIGGNTGDVLHWVAWNIPATPNATVIAEGKLPAGAVNGKNVTGKNAYMGPGAPPGPRYHHYVFEFYALNSKLDLPETASRDELLAAMKGKTVAKAGYIGRFKGAPAPAGAAPPATK